MKFSRNSIFQLFLCLLGFVPTLQSFKLLGDLSAHGNFFSEELLLSSITDISGPHQLEADRMAVALGIEESRIRDLFLNSHFQARIGGFPVPIRVTDDGSRAWLYVPQSRSIYYRGEVIQWVLAPSHSFSELDSYPETDLVPFTTARITQRYEENRIAVPTAPGSEDSEFWMWESLIGSHPVLGRRSYPLHLNDLALIKDSTTDVVRFEIHMVSTSESNHEIQVLVNEHPVHTQAWTGKSMRKIQVEVPVSLMDDADNLLSLVNSGSRTSLVYLDAFEVQTILSLNSVVPGQTFTLAESGPHRVGVSNDTNRELWDVTDPLAPSLLTQWVLDPDSTPPSILFQGRAGQSIVLHSPESAHPFHRLRPITPPDAMSEDVFSDYLLIVPHFLRSAIEPLIAHRTSQGLQCEVVTSEFIQDHFAQGYSTPYAVLEFLRTLERRSAPPAYVFLVGNGTLDFRNDLGLSDNWIPPLLVNTSAGRFPSDVLLADPAQTGTWQWAVGRLPIRSAEEFQDWFAKLQESENLPLQQKNSVLLLADHPDAAGNFIADSEVLRGLLEPGGTAFTLYNESNNLSSIRDALPGFLEQQPVLWNYIGHGSRDRLGNGYLLTSDVSTLPSVAMPPVLIAMTCGAGHFAVPGLDSIAGQLLKRRNGGVIAAWSPSGFSQNFHARTLNQSLFRILPVSGNQPRLGDLARNTLLDYRDRQGDQDLPLLYNLLGDPATRLNLSAAAIPQVPELSLYTQTVSTPAVKQTFKLEWSPGVPPYQLEMSGSLSSENWQPIRTLWNHRTRLTLQNDSAFFRVRNGD